MIKNKANPTPVMHIQRFSLCLYWRGSMVCLYLWMRRDANSSTQPNEPMYACRICTTINSVSNISGKIKPQFPLENKTYRTFEFMRQLLQQHCKWQSRAHKRVCPDRLDVPITSINIPFPSSRMTADSTRNDTDRPTFSTSEYQYSLWGKQTSSTHTKITTNKVDTF
jgi:hypothetical protein